MGCGVMPDGSYECSSECTCGLSWYWQPAPELNKVCDGVVTGYAWKRQDIGTVAYVATADTPDFVQNPWYVPLTT